MRVRAVVIVAWIVFWASSGPNAAGADRRALRLHDIHRGEDLSVRPFGHYGIPARSAWLRLSHFWRSRTGERIVVHPRLLRILVQVQRHFAARRLELFSGYRAPVDPRQLSSYHQVGHAADVSIAGVAHRAVFEYCRRLPDLGCGYYPRGRHVHIDVRSRATVWVDLSGYGDGGFYVRDPAAWLGVHR